VNAPFSIGVNAPFRKGVNDLMNTTNAFGPIGDHVVDRRSLLWMVAGGAAAIGASSLFTGCGSPPPAPVAPGGAAGGGDISSILPSYIPIEYAKPDFPSVNGTTPGYVTLPEKLVRSVPTPPGTGSVFTVMTPLWGTIPKAEGNQYYKGVNEILGSEIKFQITDGNTYGDKLATVLASFKDVPDWVCVPAWNLPKRFGSEIVDHVFEDLTPYLAGDKVKAYPNLANIPTGAWKSSVFNGKLYGLPMPGDIAGGNPTFYRKNLLDKMGITPDVKSADDLLALVLELTDAKAGHWGCGDLWLTACQMFAVPGKWKVDDKGLLVHRTETEEYRAALDWTTKLFDSGAVHPDEIAKTGDSLGRFNGGQLLVANQGWGAWGEALSNLSGGDPEYSQMPLPLFAAVEGDKPVLYKGAPASIYSFLKKNDDKAVIEEMLALANVIAAPFGTTEFDLIQNGIEGVHFTKGEKGIPVPTPLAAKELQPTYVFLVDGPTANAKVQFPGFVQAQSEYLADAAQYLVEDAFYGMQISEPPRYASLQLPFDDLETEIVRGRKSLKDLDAALATWKSSGGEKLRTFYQEILDKK